jgi:hypothetical protein
MQDQQACLYSHSNMYLCITASEEFISNTHRTSLNVENVPVFPKRANNLLKIGNT